MIPEDDEGETPVDIRFPEDELMYVVVFHLPVDDTERMTELLGVGYEEDETPVDIGGFDEMLADVVPFNVPVVEGVRADDTGRR